MGDLIVFIVAIALISFLLFSVLMYRGRLIKVTNMLSQVTIDKIILADKLNAEIAKSQGNSIEQTDGFLKFVSQSRDWAFQYIEEVQAAIQEFDMAIEESKVLSPKEAIKNILVAHAKLKEVLPKE